MTQFCVSHRKHCESFENLLILLKTMVKVHFAGSGIESVFIRFKFCFLFVGT